MKNEKIKDWRPKPYLMWGTPYDRAKAASVKPLLRMAALAVAGMNLFLLLPELTLVKGEAIAAVALLRIAYSIVLVAFSLWAGRIYNFTRLSFLITLVEVTAILLFFFVILQYRQPNFLLETLGLAMLATACFLVPNRWTGMVTVALLTDVGFFVCILLQGYVPDIAGICMCLLYIALHLMMGAVFSLHFERRGIWEFAEKQELRRICCTDHLTNTANRYKMEEEAIRWMEFCRRQQLPLCLVFADVDNLKAINDQYGHTEGDMVLEQMATVIRKHLRRSDTIARWGGDEFLLLLPDSSVEEALAVTKRIRDSVRLTPFGRGIHVTCSFGVVEMKERSTFSSMIAQADGLMYTSKARGKDAVEWSG